MPEQKLSELSNEDIDRIVSSLAEQSDMLRGKGKVDMASEYADTISRVRRLYD